MTSMNTIFFIKRVIIITKKEILKYKEKTAKIPKDHIQRLKYLHKVTGFSKKDLEYVLSKVDEFYNPDNWEEIHYIFYMNPKASERPHMNGSTRIFYVRNAKNYKEMFDEFMELHSNAKYIITTPTEMQIRAYIEAPASMNKRELLGSELELIRCTSAPDWDNIGKTYGDMVQHTLILDDSIVTRGEVEKFYSILPRIEIDIYFMRVYDCKYNKRKMELRKSFKESPIITRDIDFII